MQHHQLTIAYTEFDQAGDLVPAEQELMELAMQAAKTAYAPYSGFHVGAALRLSNGAIVTGNNQENAAYPSGLCAERVAMFAASAQYPGVAFEGLAIYAFSEKISVDMPVTPCGSCRQVMAEYDHYHEKHFRILLMGEHSKLIAFDGVEALLPLMFSPKSLTP